jgi:site-specific DNA recombinase
MDSTLKTVRPQVREFDEGLVRRLIKTIRVNKGEKLEIQFESGIVMEQTVDYYD